MTDAYRQKLLNWFTSMLLVLLIAIIPSLFFLLTDRMIYIVDIDVITFYLAGSLSDYIGVFVPLFIWHVGDFTHDFRSSSVLAKLLSSYKLLAGLLVALGLSIMFGQSSFLNDLGCPPEPELPKGVFQFDGCGSWTPEWKMWLTMSFWLAICLLALWKVAVSVFTPLWNNR